MSMKFMTVCSVVHGADNDLIECGMTDERVRNGDFVFLENGVRGFVANAVLMSVEGPEFALLSNYTDVNEITDIYAHRWSKEEASND